MSKRNKRNKRLDNAYNNYKKRFEEAQKQFAKKGKTMYDDILMSKSEYLTNRQLLIDEGYTKNINQTIVSAQKYQYSQKMARRIKEGAKKLGLDYKDISIYELRQGAIDLSAINNQLKADHPDWTGKQRAKYISHGVYGSE